MSDEQTKTCTRELKGGEDAIKVVGGTQLQYELTRIVASENIIMILLILIVAVLIVMYRRTVIETILGRRKKYINSASHNPNSGEEATSATTNSTSSTFCHLSSENESEEDLFEKNWPAIRISRYRRLVLPPECKVVDVPVFVWKQESEDDMPKEIDQDSKRKIEEDEQPLARFANYGRSLFCKLRELVRFDYFGLDTIFHRIIELCTLVKFKQPRLEELKDKDESKSDEIQGSPFVEKEKKDYIESSRSVRFDCGSPMRRSCSDSFYDTSIADENDVGERPLLSALDLSSRLVVGSSPVSRKKRDFLEKYLSQPNMPLHHDNAEPAPQIPNLTEREAKESHNVGFSIDETNNAEAMRFFDAAQTKATLRKLQVDVPVPDRYV